MIARPKGKVGNQRHNLYYVEGFIVKKQTTIWYRKGRKHPAK